jgi:hypothetical protein
MWHVWETVEVYMGFWWRDPREKNHLKDLGLDGRIIHFNIILFKK